MRKTRNSNRGPGAGGPGPSRRLLLHPAPGLRRAVDPDEIYFVEAVGDDLTFFAGGPGGATTLLADLMVSGS